MFYLVTVFSMGGALCGWCCSKAERFRCILLILSRVHTRIWKHYNPFHFGWRYFPLSACGPWNYSTINWSTLELYKEEHTVLFHNDNKSDVRDNRLIRPFPQFPLLYSLGERKLRQISGLYLERLQGRHGDSLITIQFIWMLIYFALSNMKNHSTLISILTITWEFP